MKSLIELNKILFEVQQEIIDGKATFNDFRILQEIEKKIHGLVYSCIASLDERS